MSGWAGLTAEHGRLFVQRCTSHGRGAAWLQVAAGVRTENDPLAPLGPARDGFIPSDNVLSGASLAEYERQIAAMKSWGGPRADGQSRAAGKSRGHAFSDPQQWPALFDPRHRADPTHLNTAGAEVFTRALAHRLFAVAWPPVEQR